MYANPHVRVLAEVSPTCPKAAPRSQQLDNFCLFYDAKTRKVGGINGSGKAPKALTLDHLRSQGITGDTVGYASRP